MVRNSESHNKEIKKALYLVSTPIGNLDDITLRAIDIMRQSDYILCEDTRISKILLNKYEIRTNLISYHKFNEKKNLPKIIKLLKSGSIISLVSDAGTPNISDPGSILVNECIKNNINIIPIPGPSSVTSAVSISGFSEKFFFYGFFPEKKRLLIDDIKVLSELDSSIVFFISSKKINKIIEKLKIFFSDRNIVICRELTKLYEEIIRLPISEIKPFKTLLKGELTIVISEKNSKMKSKNLDESDKKIIKKLLKKMTIKNIINQINKDKKISKKIIYEYCLKLKNEK